jgi:hypothetical protein
MIARQGVNWSDKYCALWEGEHCSVILTANGIFGKHFWCDLLNVVKREIA